MRKFILILFGIGIVCFVALSCNDDDVYIDSIIGEWNWIGTIGDPGPIYPS